MKTTRATNSSTISPSITLVPEHVEFSESETDNKDGCDCDDDVHFQGPFTGSGAGSAGP